MPSDVTGDAQSALDVGLLSPVTVGADRGLDDESLVGCLIAAEVALTRAWSVAGVAPAGVADEVSAALGWQGPGLPCAVPAGFPVGRLVTEAVAGGNPVIPIVAMLRERVPERARGWVHRGTTSQDIVDTALMLAARGAATRMLADLRQTEGALCRLASERRDQVAAGRTLTQHAVPTTVGLRAAGWLRGIRRAIHRLELAAAELPAQLAGAAGTLAAYVEVGGVEAASRLPGLVAAELGLAEPDGPWHTVRWPLTEFGDALVQVVDAVGVLAADVATLSRTEIGELAEGVGGGSSAMPQKQNPAGAVLIRSAALRAPQLGATLHLAAALAVDERPDGPWQAEWPTLRELARLAGGAAATAARLTAGLAVDDAAVRRNLQFTHGLIVAERLSHVLGPVLGAARVKELVAAAGEGGDLGELLRAEPAVVESAIDIDDLLDPAAYTGLAGALVDAAVTACAEGCCPPTSRSQEP